jgi:hypothetical protein
MSSDGLLFKDGRFKPISEGKATPQGEAKLRVYDWSEDLGKRGRNMQINKRELRMDGVYQRDGDIYRARRIASNFRWAAFGMVIVSERENGNYYVIDGGHRVLAAMMRPDVDNIPCVVFSGLSRTEEAAAFVYYNAKRRTIVGVSLYRGLVEAKNPEALLLKKVLDELGISVCDRDRQPDLHCPMDLIKIVHKYGPELVKDCLKAVCGAWPDKPTQERFGGYVLRGICLFRALADARHISVGLGELTKLLERVGLKHLREQAVDMHRGVNLPMHMAVRYVLIQAWNFKRRTNRLSEMDDSANDSTQVVTKNA